MDTSTDLYSQHRTKLDGTPIHLRVLENRGIEMHAPDRVVPLYIPGKGPQIANIMDLELEEGLMVDSFLDDVLVFQQEHPELYQ